MNLQQLTTLTRSAALAIILAGLVACLPGLRKIQVAEAAGAPLPLPRFTEAAALTLATQDPSGFCTSRVRIVQECSLAALSGIQELERQVIADLLALHQLPASAAPPRATPPAGRKRHRRRAARSSGAAGQRQPAPELGAGLAARAPLRQDRPDYR